MSLLKSASIVKLLEFTLFKKYVYMDFGKFSKIILACKLLLSASQKEVSMVTFHWTVYFHFSHIFN